MLGSGIAAVVITTLLAIFFIRRKFKIKTSDGHTKSSSLLQFMLDQNPQIIEHMISPQAENAEKIKEEVKKFHGIKEVKEINKTTIEILVKYDDDSEHWYRAERESSDREAKITSLKKFS